MAAAVMHPLQPPGFVSRYHVGEQRMQVIAGSPANVEVMGRNVIRVGFMTEQYRDFYTGLVQFFVATHDEAGRPWCSVVCGPLGFISSPDKSSLVINAYPLRQADPVNLAVGQSVGGLGLMMHNRRRNRVNSTLAAREGSRLSLRVDQAFGNCPKYIQVRNVSFDEVAAARMQGGPPPTVQRGKGALPAELQRMVERADTIFLATYHDSPDAPPGANGCDASHRGGPPGFVRVADGGATVLWPDYIGNWMFNTIGNLLMNSLMGILFVDYEHGATTLQLTGRAEVINDSLGIPGAQRVLKLSIEEYIHASGDAQIDGGLPLKLDGSVRFSPYLPEADAADKPIGMNTATVVAIEEEAEGIKTFTLAVPTGLDHLPGQFASFDIEVDGKKVNRTWTVSSDPEWIRRYVKIQITVKRAAYISAWLHDHLQVDDTLQLRGFDGDFTPQSGERPVLMLAGGIGVTPMRAMLPTFREKEVDVVLIYSVRTPAEAAFAAEFQEAAAAGGVRIIYTVTGATEAAALPAAGLTQGNITWLPGRISEAMIAAMVPDVAGRAVYMCGPQPYMDTAAAILGGLGVPTDHLYQESFSF